MDNPLARPNATRDGTFDRLAMGPVVQIDDVVAAGSRKWAGDFREQLWMTDRPVQVDQQPRRGGDVQRRTESLGHLPAQFEGAGVPAAVTVQRILPARK
jgi:hypothetical protein